MAIAKIVEEQATLIGMLKGRMGYWADHLDDMVESSPGDPFNELVKEIRETAKLL